MRRMRRSAPCLRHGWSSGWARSGSRTGGGSLRGCAPRRPLAFYKRVRWRIESRISAGISERHTVDGACKGLVLNSEFRIVLHCLVCKLKLNYNTCITNFDDP